MLAIAFQENKLGFVLLCLTNESYPSFCAKELWTFERRLPRESVENNYLAFVVQWIEINSEVFFVFHNLIAQNFKHTVQLRVLMHVTI